MSGAILFDLDGTLTLPAAGIVNCIRHALDVLQTPVAPDEDLSLCVGPPLRGSFARLLQTDNKDRIEAAMVAYRERFADVGYLENEVVVGIEALLAACRADGRAMHVATSKPTVYAVKIVEHFGLRPYFGAVHGSELDGTRTKKPELLAHVLREEGLDAATTTMIGDRRHDVEGAHANGVASIGVLWGYGSRDELRDAEAGVICEVVRELREALIGSWPHPIP